MPSKQFNEFYQTLQTHIPTGQMTFQEIRVYFEKMLRGFPASNDITFTPATFKHCSGTWINPPKVTSKKILFFLHGGGYTAGSWETHQDMLGRIASYGEIRICAINYRLAPEHPFPAALNDALKAYEELQEHGRIIVGGSSAGGGLSLALMLKLKELKKPLPCAGVLLCPWVDLAHTGETLNTHNGLDMINKERLIAAASAYLGKHNPKDPLASPLYGDLSYLPPLLIQAGTIEILWSEIEALVKKARRAGTSVTFQPFEGMFHTWQLFAAKIPEGDQALKAIGSFIRSI
jgi:acetyl esterase/lipase